MTDSIAVRGIHAEGRHGLASEGERDTPQPFVVDVELRRDLGPAASADRLSKTIDYREVTDEVRRVIEHESFELVETIAETIAKRLERFGADSVLVRVSKPHVAALMNVDEIAVVVER